MPTVTDDPQSLASAEFDGGKPGLVWTWWLRNARSDGPGLRRWQLWIWWTRQRGPAMRIVAVFRILLGFFGAPFEAWAGLRRYGDKTTRIHGIARVTQFWQLLFLRWRFGVRAESYYKFQMFRPELFPSAHNFVEEPSKLLQAILRHSPRTSDERLFLSKEEFRLWCLENKIPTVQNLIEVREGRVVSRFVAALPAVDLYCQTGQLDSG